MRFLLLLLSCLPLCADLGSYTARGRQNANVVAYYRLDESSGNFSDIVGGNTATASGAGITYSATGGLAGVGDANNAATFNGSTGNASITNQTPFNFEYTSSFTIEALVNPTITRSGTATEYCIFGKMQSSGNFTGYSLELYWDGTSKTQIRGFLIGTFPGSNMIQLTTTTIDIPNGSWSHVAMTYDGTTMRLYYNGALVGNANRPFSSITTINNVAATIGSRNTGLFFKGSIDELAVYNTVLSQAVLGIHYFYSVASEPVAASSAPINLIYDDDGSDDIDNSQNLYFLLQMQHLGYINLLGVIVTESNTLSASCVQQYLIYSGRSNVPVGAYQGGDESSTDQNSECSTMLGVLRSSFPLQSTYTSATAEYRTLLSAAADGSVYLLMGGSGASLYDFLNDSGPPTGANLFAQKVARTTWVAGTHPSGTGDYNFSSVTKSKTSANWILANWPTSVPLDFVGTDQGSSILVGSSASTLLATNNPLRLMWASYGGASRPAWAQIAAMHLLFDPTAGYFASGGSNGTVTVNASTGANSWAATPNANQSYLTIAKSVGLYQGLTDIFIHRELHPWFSTWSASAF